MTTHGLPSFGELLRRYREAARLTQEALAEQAGLSARGLSDLERGTRRFPHPHTVELLADALRLEPTARAHMLQVSRRVSVSTAGVAQAGLPLQPGRLIGRADDVRRICQALEEEGTRLLTLAGPGGIGKTRLAIEIAVQLRERFADGVFFVDLAPVLEPDSVGPTIATALELQELGSRPPLPRLKDYLRPRQVLLVLDNFEQVLAASPQITFLVAECPRLRILVTTREPLRSRWEHVYRLEPLRVPELRWLSDVAEIAITPSVELFTERARAIQRRFELTPENIPVIAEICMRLDGLPLAIELAAARSHVLAPKGILEHLDRRLLRTRATDVPARHRSLRAAMDWSYDLLGPQEQIGFRRLGVFAGGWSLEAAQGVIGADPLDLDILSVVESLVDKSLVQVVDSEAGPRFRMLETIREFARDCMEAETELDLVRERHAQYFLQLAAQGELELRSAQQLHWLDRLESEHDEFRAALAWSLSSPQRIESGYRLGWELGWFWFLHAHYAEGLVWLERLLDHSDGIAPVLRAGVLARAGTLAHFARRESEFGTPADLLRESVALSREEESPWLVAYGVTMLAIIAAAEGDFDLSSERSTESFALFRELGDRWGSAWALHELGVTTHRKGDYERAQICLRESLAIHREVGDAGGLAAVLHDLGRVVQAVGLLDDAQSLYEESLGISRRAAFRLYTLRALNSLARIGRERGDLTQGRTYLDESLLLAARWDDRFNVLAAIDGLAGLAAIQSDWPRAARLFGAVEGLRNRLESPGSAAERANVEKDVTLVRAHLSEKTFGLHTAAGRLLSLEAAIAEAAGG